MRRLVLAALGLPLLLPVPLHAEVVISISKAQQRMAVVVDGTEAYRWPVSTGLRRYATPAGTFRPGRLERHWYSRQYQLTPMPWSMFFFRGYAVHATMEAHNLGRPASHGCVRLRPDNAAILYSMVRRHGLDNTKVVVLNGPLPAAPEPSHGTPMAAVDTPAQIETTAKAVTAATTDVRDAERHFAKAEPAELAPVVPKPRQELSARRSSHADRDSKPRQRMQWASVEALSVSVSDNEAQVLRERAAWLRSIDRKYGIVR